MIVNSVGREIPETVNGRALKPYAGPFSVVPADAPVRSKRRLTLLRP